MSSERYQYRPPVNKLPPDFSCDNGNFAYSFPSYQLPPYIDGLPRIPTDQQMSNTWSPLPIYNYSLANPMSISDPQASAEWTQPHSSSVFDDQSTDECFPYSGNNTGSHHEEALLRDHSAGVPRNTNWSMPYNGNMLNDSTMTSSAYEQSYTINPMSEDPKSCGLQYDQQDSSQDFARMSISPKIEIDPTNSQPFSFESLPPSGMPGSETSDESMHSSREMTAIEVEDHGADEPYAKLIYRALMSVENHAMVLQEIYKWFRENTNKGSSDTKGWMNSIRHNLSMNAAFKKTERRTSGDEAKKSTEWVLEDFAIKDGVQSTTRYRKGAGSKKFARFENPAPARQSSGRKGGICANKNKLLRHRFKDDRSDLQRSTPRIDPRMQLQFHDGRTPQIIHRHMSPRTPNPESIPSFSPYFMPKQEPDPEDTYGLPEGIHSLNDVAVFPDDESPIFSNNHNHAYHNTHQIYGPY